MPKRPSAVRRVAAVLALFGLTGWSSPPVAKQPQLPTSIPVAPMDGRVDANACAPLSLEEGWVVRDKLIAFSVVYGKPALDWTEDDYRNLVNLAKACHNVVIGRTTIDGNNWATMLGAAYDVVMPVALMARQVETYAVALGSDGLRLPRCPAMLDFHTDPYTLADNSQDIFGTSFMAATDDDLNRVVLYANQCLTYLPEYARLAKQWRASDGEELLGRLMDRALFVIKRRQDWADWNRRDTDVLVRVDGLVVPPTMTSRKAREMIERYDRAAAPGRRFTSETVSVLVRMVDEVMEVNATQYDMLYAEAIQKRVQDQIFNKVPTATADGG